MDVVAGARLTLDNFYKEAETGHAYAFSPSYFYGLFGDSVALKTTGDDSQWSDFVYWVVMATIYAEQYGKGDSLLDFMPPVNLFGEGFTTMFRDIVDAQGSYKDIYSRTLGVSMPRSARNQLNAGQFSGPQHYPIPL